MSSFKDITGERFGRLVVESLAGRDKNKKIKWTCLCDCGTRITTTSNNLRTGGSRSCGCLRLDRLRAETLVGKDESKAETPNQITLIIGTNYCTYLLDPTSITPLVSA